MAAASRRGWALHFVGPGLEWSEQLENLMITVKISLTRYVCIRKGMTMPEQLL